MSLPVASLLSPKHDYVLLYQITDQQQFGISRFSFDSKNQAIFRYKNRPGPNPGPLQRPSAISAVYVNDLPTVYGSVEIVVDDTAQPPKKGSIVAQLSPQLYSIADKEGIASISLPTDNLSLAAVSDGADQVWLYYFQQAKTGDPLALAEAYISGNDAPEVKLPDKNIEPYSKSRLAGAFIPDPNGNPGRIVFYQRKVDDENNPIHALLQISNANTSTEKLPSTDAALKGTPLAAVVVGQMPDYSVYLYFLSTAIRIERCVFRKGKWNAAEEVKGVNKDANLTSKETGLTAVVGEKGISLFYVQKKSVAKEYSFAIDPFDYHNAA
ncbi:hypothetical protein AYL99_03686 [Fonsecaea erecta]|uniref:Fucose-specific lectin n=1 Tax=Fonsecaea erecta TaxID=1367422 RepID=A0A178ZQL8_9EURO|nr:hypothetical protein AYL99_03686 [Fonsecaea erecta]OAP61483.1 hypothetical protein AYL99_03686 [Fonsecaea erecta]